MSWEVFMGGAVVLWRLHTQTLQGLSVQFLPKSPTLVLTPSALLITENAEQFSVRNSDLLVGRQGGVLQSGKVILNKGVGDIKASFCGRSRQPQHCFLRWVCVTM